MKKCTKCGETKNNKSFSKDRKLLSGLSSHCKDCVSIYGKQYRKKVNTREQKLKFKYGISMQQVEEMYTLQRGCCLICGVFKSNYSRLGGLLVDHDHLTGNVRGLLCTNCNILLGRAKDSPSLLVAAIAYLDFYSNKKG